MRDISLAEGFKPQSTFPVLVRRKWRRIAVATVVAGTADLLFATAIWSAQGLPPIIVPQSVASGILGAAAFAMGLRAAILGLALHYLIMAAMALGFAMLANRWHRLAQTRWAWGLAYGCFLYAIMNFIIVPLSRSPVGLPPLPIALADLAAHALLVGLPIALLVTDPSSRRQGR